MGATDGELKIGPSLIRPLSRPGPKRLTQHKKVVHRQKVVRGYEGRPSRKHLNNLSTLRKFSKYIYIQKAYNADHVLLF